MTTERTPAGPRVVLRRLPTLAAVPPRVIDGDSSLPLAGSQSGSLFHDSSTATLAWFLPSFALVDDVDPAFAFSATNSHKVDGAGNPFATGKLSIGIRSVIPDDAVAFQKQNPTYNLQPIPLEELTATLTLVSYDATTGAQTPRTVSGVFTTDAQGRVQFNALVGTSVIIAYENLMEGGASLTLAGSYHVVRSYDNRPPGPGSDPHPIVPPGPLVHPPKSDPPHPPGPVTHPPGPVFRPPGLVVHPPGPVVHPPGSVVHPPGPVVHPPGPATTRYVLLVQPFTTKITLGRKFAGIGYPPGYKLDDGLTTRVIASVSDLRDFNAQQSEFSEFTRLGDVSRKYPSFSRLYVGAISRVIVAVPAHYGIMRGAHGTDAVCHALLDVSATGSGACMFQFSFTIGPSISAIELLQLTRELATMPAVHDCMVVLPSQLDPKGGSTLTTLFQGAVTYDVGASPNTFQVTVAITDRDNAQPSVAVANQFIRQLVEAVPPFLMGKMRVLLDDDYPTPIETSVVLNFQVTSDSDEITVEATADGVALMNASPLDLQVHRYALVSKNDLQVVSFEQTLPSKQRAVSASAPLAEDTQVVVERALSLSFPLTKADTNRYLAFEVSDVQNVQYQVGVSAASVDFKALHIARIDVVVTLTDLPQLTVPSFTLAAANRSGTEQVFLPIQNAIGSLNGLAAFTVQALDATVSPISFTIPNDFLAQPVIVLTSANIPPFLVPPVMGPAAPATSSSTAMSPATPPPAPSMPAPPSDPPAAPDTPSPAPTTTTTA